jgi:hypothetical protein
MRGVGKANGARERAPDDRLRVPTVSNKNGGHGAGCAFAHPTELGIRASECWLVALTGPV